MKSLHHPKFAIAVSHFAQSCCASREHSALARVALREHGDHGPSISGIVRDHFPEPIRTRLRELATACAHHSDAAWAARPPRVTTRTMRRLASHIAARDGSGFYGPQP